MSEHIHTYSNGWCECGDHIVTQGPHSDSESEGIR